MLRLEAHQQLRCAHSSVALAGVRAHSACSCPTSILQPSSSIGQGAAQGIPQLPSHQHSGTMSFPCKCWFGRQLACECSSVCKKAWPRAVKLPQTTLNMFLQPLCKSLWQLRYALCHTYIFTPSPPTLSWAGFSARSLVVGFPKLWLVAQPQLLPAGLIPS